MYGSIANLYMRFAFFTEYFHVEFLQRKTMQSISLPFLFNVVCFLDLHRLHGALRFV